MTRSLICGAGGFIAGHLAKALLDRGDEVLAVDIKPREEWWQWHEGVKSIPNVDLRITNACKHVVGGVDEVYQLAANIGGIGWITAVHADIARDNTYIDLNMLEASRLAGVKRYLWASSACAYPIYRQSDPNCEALSEDMAWPADPEPGYGLEKLYGEELCKYYSEDYGLLTHCVRFHNVFGPKGSWTGGKEKAPAAACRKVASTPSGGVIDIWGDGLQTRSFMYIDDCIEGLIRLQKSNYQKPLNLGRSEVITINGLFELVADVAGKTFVFKHDMAAPQGVRGRNSDNSRLRNVLGWEPEVSLRQGIEKTYLWIEKQVEKHVDKH